jgi:hypothetical protein
VPIFEVLSWRLTGVTQEDYEKTLHHGGYSPGRNPSPGSPENESGILTTAP